MKNRRRHEQEKAKLLSVPTEADWGEYQGDLDTEWTYREYLGKSNADMRSTVIANPLSATEALRYMAPIPFRYYALGFNQLLLDSAFTDECDSADAASSFISAIDLKLKEDPQALLPILKDIYPTLQQLCTKQDELGATREIYGNFSERLVNIEKLLTDLGAQVPK